MEILFELIARAVCFPVGWPVVKLITLGKYPSKGAWFAETPEAEWTMGIGLAVLVITMMAVLKQFVFT